MTKADIVNEITNKTNLEKNDVLRIVELTMSSVKNSLIKGENVYLRGFGSFIIKKRAQKIGRNISKNTAITIPEHFIPAFKPAKIFVEKVKKNVKSAPKEDSID
ncbi:MAG: integration host factor subunit beta [Bacteroidia bacterium]|nr:integration host factor subunit beta [Bacteroidia bacterium]